MQIIETHKVNKFAIFHGEIAMKWFPKWLPPYAKSNWFYQLFFPSVSIAKAKITLNFVSNWSDRWRNKHLMSAFSAKHSNEMRIAIEKSQNYFVSATWSAEIFWAECRKFKYVSFVPTKNVAHFSINSSCAGAWWNRLMVCQSKKKKYRRKESCHFIEVR